MKKEIDPLKQKEDIRIDKNDGDGFLKTLTKVVKSKEPSKKEGS